ncbi:MAG: GspE/PulE family protein, partial [Campylobacter hyointestinalis]
MSEKEELISGPEFYQKPKKDMMNSIDKQVLLSLVKDKKLDSSLALELEGQIIENGVKNTLVNNNYITNEDFLLALFDLYKRDRINLKDVSEHFMLDSNLFLTNLAKYFKFTYCDLENTNLDYNLSSKFPVAQLKKMGALPIKEDEINVYVAFKNPFDIEAQDRVSYLFNRKLLKIAVCDPVQIDKYMSKIELNESVNGLISDIRKEIGNNTASDNDSSGILKLIETILKSSIEARASDIHIEPSETHCIVRSRIDGMLTESFIFDKDIYPPLVSRIKLLSNMDIAERRKPQDGRFSAQISGREYDFRISTLPILNGESIVLRILDKSKVIISLENLG